VVPVLGFLVTVVLMVRLHLDALAISAGLVAVGVVVGRLARGRFATSSTS
jgi:hypothetical protein